MKPATLLILLAVGVGAAATTVIFISSDGGSAAALELSFARGDQFRQEYSTTQTVTQTMNGRPQSSSSQTTYGFAFTVDERLDDGSAHLTFTYEWVSVFLAGLANVAYDSRQPEQPQHPAVWSYAALVGTSLKIHVTPRGEVLSVEGIDDLVAAILAREDRPDGLTDDALEKGIRTQINARDLKATLEESFAIYPRDPVRVGDRWQRAGTLATSFPLTAEHEWELAVRRDDLVRISVLSNVRTREDANVVELGPMKVRYDLTGTRTGTIDLDPKTHWIQSMKAEQKLEGTASAEGMVGIPIEVTTTIAVTASE